VCCDDQAPPEPSLNADALRRAIAHASVAGSPVSLGTNSREHPTNVEIIRHDEVRAFVNSGVRSHQLLFPENSTSSRVTITKVVFEPGAVSPRHQHPSSEQVWVALRGTGLILLANDETVPFSTGDIVRFEDGDIHGFQNTGPVPFEYLSVTSPPVNFRAAYAASWAAKP
jgi:quercetin dioxygenase-like cupin family protein